MDRANHRCKLTVCNMMAAVDYNGKCDNENETSNDCGQITFTECNLFHHVQQWLSPHKLIRIMWDQTNNRQLKRCDKIITHQCHRAAVCHFKCSWALWAQDETQIGIICLVSESPQKDQIRSDHLRDLQFHIMFLQWNVVMWRKLCFCSEVCLFVCLEGGLSSTSDLVSAFTQTILIVLTSEWQQGWRRFPEEVSDSLFLKLLNAVYLPP